MEQWKLEKIWSDYSGHTNGTYGGFDQYEARQITLSLIDISTNLSRAIASASMNQSATYVARNHAATLSEFFRAFNYRPTYQIIKYKFDTQVVRSSVRLKQAISKNYKVSRDLEVCRLLEEMERAERRLARIFSGYRTNRG